MRLGSMILLAGARVSGRSASGAVVDGATSSGSGATEMTLIASATAATAANRLAFNAWAKGKHDDLVCTSLENLTVQLAGKHKGATADGLLALLRANPKCYEHDDAGRICRVPRCQFTKRASARLQGATA